MGQELLVIYIHTMCLTCDGSANLKKYNSEMSVLLIPWCKQDHTAGVALACLNWVSLQSRSYCCISWQLPYLSTVINEATLDLVKALKILSRSSDRLAQICLKLSIFKAPSKRKISKKEREEKRVQGHRLGILCEHFSESNLPHSELCFRA